MSSSKRTKPVESRIKSSHDREMQAILDDIASSKLLQLEQTISDVAKHKSLQDLEDTDLTERQKSYYLYQVKPNLEHLYRLYLNGATAESAGRALGVPVAAFYAIRRNIPEVGQILDLAKQVKVEEVMNNAYRLASFETIEEEVIDRTGKKVIIQKERAPSMQAIKFIAEHEGPKNYRKSEEDNVKITLNKDLLHMIQNMSTADLERANNLTKAIEVYPENETVVDDDEH